MGNNAGGLYALTEEHEAIREAVREIAEREIAPHAADVDANSRYPIEAQKALTAAGFHATHIPEQYGGEGADAIATCIVIEEVARVDVSASLIPADRIIGAPGTGFKTALRTLDFTRPTIGAQAVGVAQGALDAAVAYVKDRKQFGKHISDFQGVQFMLADMAMKVEAARHLVYVAAATAERGEPTMTFRSSAATDTPRTSRWSA